ncbi:MAG TPA: hypothetical protein DEB39_09630 [Planctomycetaceae bacterium]|nr:hypothetical protein [Planctomycetaceae bacterium]
MKKYFCTLLLFMVLASASACRQTNGTDSVSISETAVISCEAARITMETVETKPENGTMNGPVEETDGNN